MTALVLSAAEYTELVRQHHTNPEGPAVLTSRGDECVACDGVGLGGYCNDSMDPRRVKPCDGGRVAPSRWATSSPTTCPECGGKGTRKTSLHGRPTRCSACGGSGATRTIELRTTCPGCDGSGEWHEKYEDPAGNLLGATWPCDDCDGGTVLVGRAASYETVPVVAFGDWEIAATPTPSVTVDDYGQAVHMTEANEDDGGWGTPIVLDPLPSPGDYALIITGYETSDTRQTEHTQTSTPETTT